MSPKVALIVGTRPCAIKMAPLARTLRTEFAMDVRVVSTAQHRHLFDQVAEVFGIRPSVDLDIMRPDQNPAQVFAMALLGLHDAFENMKPNMVLVQGDTATAIAGAWAAFLRGIRVGHVEAGLRTHDKRQPFPEEINRRQVSVIADYHFAPTPQSAGNLRAEGIREENICVSGQTGIDALAQSVTAARARRLTFIPPEAGERRIVLLTAHRRENFGKGLSDIGEAVRTLARTRDDIWVVCPVHPNPHVTSAIRGALGRTPRVSLVEPLSYLDFVALMDRSYLILTDSGGLQEEGPHLGKPVLVLRETTERPEAVDSGAARLTGTDPEKIVSAVAELLDNPAVYRQMTKNPSPFGDGHACRRIGEFLASRGFS